MPGYQEGVLLGEWRLSVAQMRQFYYSVKVVFSQRCAGFLKKNYSIRTLGENQKIANTELSN